MPLKLEEVDEIWLRAWVDAGAMTPGEYRIEMARRGLLQKPIESPANFDLKTSLAAARVLKNAGNLAEAFELLALVIDSLPETTRPPEAAAAPVEDGKIIAQALFTRDTGRDWKDASRDEKDRWSALANAALYSDEPTI
jgi:hypothetical protein